MLRCLTAHAAALARLSFSASPDRAPADAGARDPAFKSTGQKQIPFTCASLSGDRYLIAR